jgi:hypothetical protein
MLLATVSPDQDLHTTQIDSRVAATTPTRPEAGERALAAAFVSDQRNTSSAIIEKRHGVGVLAGGW